MILSYLILELTLIKEFDISLTAACIHIAPFLLLPTDCVNDFVFYMYGLNSHVAAPHHCVILHAAQHTDAFFF